MNNTNEKILIMCLVAISFVFVVLLTSAIPNGPRIVTNISPSEAEVEPIKIGRASCRERV